MVLPASDDVAPAVRRRPRCLRRNQDGHAAVEFALIAGTFVALLGGILELSGIMFVQTLLEGGAREAARYGITGATEEGHSRMERIADLVAENSFGIVDPAEVEIIVRVYDRFSAVAQPEPFDDQNGNSHYDAGEAFDDVNGSGAWEADQGVAGAGDAEAVVLYRLLYDWDVIIPLFRPFLGERVRLEARVAVRNEPF